MFWAEIRTRMYILVKSEFLVLKRGLPDNHHIGVISLVHEIRILKLTLSMEQQYRAYVSEMTILLLLRV